MQIRVWQHIYSNVPREQSPRKRRGYQTLFYSHDGLSSEEVLEMEDRAQYYGGEAEPTKRQFFMLPDGKAVVSQIVPLAELDEFGRKGRYLSHSLILSPTDFLAMENSPIPLFMPSNFITDLAGAFEMGDGRTGNLALKSIRILDDWQDQAMRAARGWPAEQLEKLARLGWRAEQLKANRKVVGFLGSEEAILNTLAIVFLLASPEVRPLLSFDTYAYGCNWDQKGWPFWAWGEPGREALNNAFLVDASSKQVRSDLSSKEDGPFERWLVQREIPRRLEHYLADQQDALEFAALLSGKRGRAVGDDPSFMQAFALINTGTLIGRLLAHFPRELSQPTRVEIGRRIQEKPAHYLQRLAAGYTKGDAAEELYRLHLHNLRRPFNSDDEKALLQLAAETGHAGLDSIVKLHAGDTNTWQKTLPKLSAADYRLIVETAVYGRVTTMPDAFVAEHIDSWLHLAPQYLRRGELAAVLKQIKKQKQVIDADEFLRLLPSLSAADRQDLADWTRAYKGPADQLRAELRSTGEAEQSLKAKVGSIFRRNKEG